MQALEKGDVAALASKHAASRYVTADKTLNIRNPPVETLLKNKQRRLLRETEAEEASQRVT